MTFVGDWETDCAIMYCFLEAVEFYSGTESKKMNNCKIRDSGRMLYGTTWRTFLCYDKITGEKLYLPRAKENPNLGYTKVKCANPHLEPIFKEFRNLYFKDFEYDSIQLTKNFEIKPHKDSKNIGESVLVAFGDYTGGNTVVAYPNDTVSYDARKQPVKFNGSLYEHWVEPFEGDRYSLVFFTQRKKK